MAGTIMLQTLFEAASIAYLQDSPISSSSFIMSPLRYIYLNKLGHCTLSNPTSIMNWVKTCGLMYRHGYTISINSRYTWI